MSDSEKELTDDDKGGTDTDDVEAAMNTDLSEDEVKNEEDEHEPDVNNEQNLEIELDKKSEVEGDEVVATEDFIETGDQSNNQIEGQENQSAISSVKESNVSSRASSAVQDVSLDKLSKLPNGCVPIFLSEPTIAIFNLKADSSLIKTVTKEAILKDLHDRAAVSDFSVLKKEINNFEGTEILLVMDEEFKFDKNYIIALSAAARDELLSIVQVKASRRHSETEKEDNALPSMLPGTYVPPIANPWVSLGSDKEIVESKVVLTRPYIKTLYQRRRRDFEAPVNFGAKPFNNEDYIEVVSYEDNSYALRPLETDKNESNAPVLVTKYTNTTWKYPRNAYTQYEPRKFTEEECQIQLEDEDLVADAFTALPYLIESIQHNEITNYFKDDYNNLAPGDTIFDNKADNDLREFQTFADLKFGKDKAITHVEWHPTIKGIIGTSSAEKTSFNQTMDNLTKVILTRSFIALWSFLDPMQPQVLLEAPADVYCFKFNPTDPNIIAGGCINGQLLLWDMESHMDDIKNVKEKMKTRNVIPIFSFDETDGPKITQIRCAALSNIENSHTLPIVDLKWLPDHYEINNLGYSKENLGQKSVQLVTAGGDNRLLFWDFRQSKAILAPPDKITNQPIGMGVAETFKHLNMRWKPTLRVQLYKSGPGGDFAPTRFSLKEVQGDRRVLEVDEKDAKTEDYGARVPGKERTLQHVNTHIYVGTEDGELVYVDWMPQKDSDTGKLQTPKPDHYWTIHDGPISSVTRNPFDRDLILVIGGWIWSLWKENVNSGPILQCCASEKPLTGGSWSPTRSSVFFVIRADGCVEIWDLLDKTHVPALIQNISSSAALTAISLYNFIKKQLLAIGDINGTLHVYEVPNRFKQQTPNELLDMVAYIEREVKRRAFVQERWNIREQQKIEKENEAKRKAGIAPQVTLTDDEIRMRNKAEYETFLQEEQIFLREMGLKDDDDDKVESSTDG